MSFFGQLFGSNDAALKTIDTVAQGIDKLYYSDEEKADDARAAKKDAANVFLEWIKNSQGQNLSRRFLTVVITITWLLFLIASVTISILSIWLAQDPVKMAETYTKLNEIVSRMDSIVMLIVAFYFTSPYMSKFSDAAIAKFNGGGNGNASNKGGSN